VIQGPHWGVLLAHLGAWTSYWEALNHVYGPLMLASMKSWGVATPKLSMVKLDDLRHCAGGRQGQASASMRRTTLESAYCDARRVTMVQEARSQVLCTLVARFLHGMPSSKQEAQGLGRNGPSGEATQEEGM